jgi:hypothetical protein
VSILPKAICRIIGRLRKRRKESKPEQYAARSRNKGASGRIFRSAAVLLAVFGMMSGFGARIEKPIVFAGAKIEQEARFKPEHETVRELEDARAAAQSLTEAVPGKGTVTMIFVPGWSFLEWKDEILEQLPNMRRLIHEGAIGALNVRTAERGLEDIYATIGAGANARSRPEWIAMGRLEPAGTAAGGLAERASVPNRAETGPAAETNGLALYRRYTGWEPGEDEIVVPAIRAVATSNAGLSSQAKPGLLGGLLREKGVNLYVFGNSDTASGKKRYAPYILMNERGTVPYGAVGEETLIPDSTRPSSVKINASGLLERWEKARGPATVIVAEWGDLYRLYSESRLYSPERFAAAKLEVLRELDAFAGKIAGRLREGDELWILSPQVNKTASSRKWHLAPVILYAPGGTAGWITSDSTRRDGIAAATDLAPTLLRYFGIEAPPEMIGRPIRVTASGESGLPEKWMRELSMMREVYELRPKLLYPFVTYEAVVLLVSLAVVWKRWRKPAGAAAVLLLSTLVAPLAILALGWLNLIHPLPAQAQLAVFAAITGAVSAFFLKTRSPFLAAGVLGGMTAAALLLDGLFGAEGMKRSVLGYDPMIGARYYGMGNEYMGILIGGTVLAAAMAMEKANGGLPPGRGVGAGRAAPRRRLAVSSHADGLAPADAAVRTNAAAHAHGAAPAGGKAGAGKMAAAAPAFASADVTAESSVPVSADEHGHTDASVSAEAAVSSDANASKARGSAQAQEAPPADESARADAHTPRSANMPRRSAWIAAAAFAAVAGYLAHPRLGTNAGGAITAAVAFGTAWMRGARALRRGGALRFAFALAGLVAAGLALLWLLNAALPTASAQQSHIGRAMSLLGDGRIDLIAATIVRKLQMNARLIGVSVWTKALAASLLVMAALLLWPRGIFRRWEARYPHCMNGFAAISVGSLAALAFNDSGIVAAATMLVYAAVPLLLLRLQEDSSSHSA